MVDSLNKPLLKGKVEWPDNTKDEISLWPNEHPRVTRGEFFSGQLRTAEGKVLGRVTLFWNYGEDEDVSDS